MATPPLLLTAFLCLIIIILILWPLVRHLPKLLWHASNLHDAATALVKSRGGTFLVNGPLFLQLDYIITSDPMNVRRIMAQNFANYDKGHDYRTILDFLGDGIINAEGESWKSQRHLVHSLLSNAEFEDHVLTTLRARMEQRLFPVLDDAPGEVVVVDMQHVVKRFMFDYICLLVLGFDDDNEPSTGYLSDAFSKLEEVVVYRHIVPKCVWKLQRWLQIGVEKKASRCCEILDEFLYQRIRIRRQEIAVEATATTKKLDLLTRMLVSDGGAGQLSNKFVRDNIFTLIGAGKDTVMSAVVWLLWLVANHPDVERRILDEIERVMAARSRSSGGEGRRAFLSKDELKKLTYLHATICETLRLYPSIPFGHKCAVGADVLPSGHVVHKGTKILFSIYSMGRMEEIWGQDCMEFKPERWINSAQGSGGSDSSIIHVPSYNFIAFFAGPRSCVGKAMALVQLKSMVSAMLWKYKFDEVEGQVVKPAFSMVLAMKDGLKMKVSKRTS